MTDHILNSIAFAFLMAAILLWGSLGTILTEPEYACVQHWESCV